MACAESLSMTIASHRHEILCSAQAKGRFVALTFPNKVLSLSEVEVYPMGEDCLSVSYFYYFIISESFMKS